MTNRHTTRLLIVIFVALVVITYLLGQAQRSLHPPPPLPTQPLEVFPGIEPSQITHIELEDVQRKHSVSLTRQAGGWQAVNENGTPVVVRGRQITDMIQNLATLRYNRVMEGTDVKAFGFVAGGFYAVRFNTGATSYTLRVGDLNSDQTLAYVQRGADPAVLEVPFQPLYLVLLQVMIGQVVETPEPTQATLQAATAAP